MLLPILPSILDFLDLPIELLSVSKSFRNTKYPISYVLPQYSKSKTMHNPVTFIFELFKKYKCRYFASYGGLRQCLLCIPFICNSVTTLIISDDYIDDKLLQLFTNLHTLDLPDNKLITDIGLKHLSQIKILKLGRNISITNVGLQYITNIHTLSLRSNSLITDDGLKYLSHVHTLLLPDNKNITDNGLQYLMSIHTLDLNFNENITDNGLRYLAGIKSLNLARNQNVTNDGLKYLTGIKKLRLFYNRNITDVGLSYISGIQILELGLNVGLTNDGLIKYMQNTTRLIFYIVGGDLNRHDRNFNITEDVINKLSVKEFILQVRRRTDMGVLCDTIRHGDPQDLDFNH